MTLTAQQLTHNFVEVIALISCIFSCIFLTFLILNSIVYAVDKPTVFDHNLKLDIEYQGNDDPELRENQLSAVTQPLNDGRAA